MTIAQAIALALQLLAGVGDAIRAGRNTLTEEDVDKALAAIDASDARLSDAIRRAREREGGGS